MNWKIKSLLLFAILLSIGCGNFEQPKSKGTEYASVESLAEVDEFVNSGEGWKLIDLRKPEEFKEGHILGAVNVWRTDITDTSYAYGGMMPTQGHMEQLLSRLGITAKDTIVIYDQKAECDAARLWWILKFYGHQNTKLLNGGLASWKRLGKELAIDNHPFRSTIYRFESEPDSSMLMMFQSVRSSNYSTLLLIDTRGKEEYSGEFHKSGAAYPGHIKGAINLDWAVAVDYDGTQKFLSAQELKARYAAIGIDGTKPVVTYCHSGVRSAHTLFVLTELLGYRNIKNYDGSWIEWSHLNGQNLR